MPSAQYRRTWLAGLALAVSYALAVWLGRATRMEGTPLALVWPAAAVGYLWLQWSWEHRRLRLDVGLLAALTVLLNAATGATAAMSVVFAVSNVLLALTTVVVVRRLGPDWRLRTGRDLAVFVAACTAGATASAAVGPLGMALLHGADPLSTALAWVLRNGCNTFVFGALALRVADSGWPARLRDRRLVEGLLTVLALTVLHVLVFAAEDPLPLTFLVLPLSMWVALRFDTTHVAAHVLLGGVAVVGLTAADLGPFGGLPPATRVFLAQGFVATAALVALTLALHRDERQVLLARVSAQASQAEADRALLETVLDTVAVGVVACDAQGRLTLFNRAAREMHGAQEDGSVPPEGWARRFHLYEPDGTTLLAPERVPLHRALTTGQVHDAVITIAPEGLPPRTVRADGRTMTDAEGRLLGAVVAQTDLSELLVSERDFRAAFEQGPTASARLDEAGVVRQLNPALRRLLARRSADLLDRPLAELVVEQDREALEQLLVQSRLGPVEVRVLRADGSSVWCELAASAVHVGTASAGLLVQLLDVQARKDHEQRQLEAARRDVLTGAGNRLLLGQRLTRLQQERSDAAAVLAYLDLDGFKAVNDDHGHAAGDEVLRVVAARLQALVRDGDAVVRLGGDEFVVLCDVSGASDPEAAADDLTRRVETSVGLAVAHGDVQLRVGVSVGTLVVRSGCDPDAVLAQADGLMYARKRAGRVAA